jgi:hypothetical protein
MKVELKLEPFHHLIIDDYYDEQSFNSVLQELISYLNLDYFESPSFGNSSFTNDGPSKVNKCFFFDSHPGIYERSVFVNFFNKFMAAYHNSVEFEEIKKTSWFFSSRFKFCHHAMVSYYGDGDSYPSHIDDGAVTWLTWINKEPKKFIGGDLFFPDFNYKIEYKNNRTVCFYSGLYHEVEKIKLSDEDGSNGRFTITHFQSSDRSEQFI